MLYGITLPTYASVKEFEGKGNFAVRKYYWFPFNLFYVKKLRLIVDMIGPDICYNIMDFGAGKAEIFKEELLKHGCWIKSVDLGDPIDPRWKFDLIICSSVLEFVDLDKTLPLLKKVLSPKGKIVVAGPTDGWAAKIYFKLIGDKKKRHGRYEIIKKVSEFFTIVDCREWCGLYFVMKVKK